MADDVRDALSGAAAAMSGNADRAQQVTDRARRGRHVRAVAMAATALVATGATALVATSTTNDPTPAPPAAPTGSSGEPIPFWNVRAVPGGLRVEFTDADLSLPPSSPCRMAYAAETAPEADGALRITILGRLDTTATRKATVGCETKGFARTVDVPTTTTHRVVIDSVRETRHEVQPATDHP